MHMPDSAREALFIEALGGMAALIDRLQALSPTIDGARQSLEQAHVELARELADRLSSFALQMDALTRNGVTKTAKAIVAHVDAATRRTLDLQKQELRETARALFAEQAQLTIDGLALATQRMLEQKRSLREQWLTHAATASTTLAASFALWTYLGWH